VVSTGGADISDVDRAVELLSNTGAQFSILQCTAGYPPKYEELNLRVISTYRERYPNVVIGYSGHDSGIAMSLVAYVLGARVIEKHFTLNRAMKGTDHAFSLEPSGMRKLVRDLERAQISLGDGIKKSYESESAPIRKMGKMIVAAKNVSPGTIAEMDMFEFRSPAEGLHPYRVEELVGLKFTKQVKVGDKIKVEDFEK
jgi:N-acetylneuraminate synthase/sialic acid synthase